MIFQDKLPNLLKMVLILCLTHVLFIFGDYHSHVLPYTCIELVQVARKPLKSENMSFTDT